MEEKKDREYFKTLAHHLMFDLSSFTVKVLNKAYLCDI